MTTRDEIRMPNVTYRRLDGVWTVTAVPTRGMFMADAETSALLDEIERLRAENERQANALWALNWGHG